MKKDNKSLHKFRAEWECIYCDAKGVGEAENLIEGEASSLAVVDALNKGTIHVKENHSELELISLKSPVEVFDA